MKRISFFLFAMMVAFTTSFSFVSCGKDDDEKDQDKTDFRDEVVGTYSNKITFYLLDDEKTLHKLSSKQEEDTDVSKSGVKALEIDEFTTSDLEEVSNGFAFNVPSVEVEEIWWQGYRNYYTTDGETYDGGYIRDKRTFSFWMAVSLEDYAETLSEEEVEAFAELLVALKLDAGTTVEELEESIDNLDEYKIVFEYEMYDKK